MQFMPFPQGSKPGSRPLPEKWSNMVSFLRRRVPFITEALGVIPVLVNDNLQRPVQSDGKTIQINPDLWDMMCDVAHQNEGQEPWFPTDNAGMAYMTLRSCLQMVLKYDQRRGTRDRKIWSEAVNNVTNQMLVDIFKLEPFNYQNGTVKQRQLQEVLAASGHYDSRFFGKSVDDVYRVLELERAKDPDDDDDPSDGQNPDKPEGDGEPNEDPGQGKGKPPKKDKKDDDQKPEDKDQDGKPQQGEEQQQDGGGEGDQQDDQPQQDPQQGQNPNPQQEPEQDESGGDGEGEDSEGDGEEDDDGGEQDGGDGGNSPCQSPSEMMGDDLGDGVPDSGMNDDLGQLVNNACADYLERHGDKLAGTGSAASREVQMAKEKPKVTLTQVLKKIRDVLPGYQWSYRKPSRSDMAHFIQTGKRTRMPSASPDPSDLIRELVIVIDFSASMGEDEIKKALSIFRKAFEHTGKGRKIRVIGFTEYVVFNEEFTEHTASHIKVGFSGGTNIFSALKFIDDERIRPSAIILVTDGCCHTLDKIRTWHYLPRLRTILVQSPPHFAAMFPGITFPCDEIM